MSKETEKKTTEFACGNFLVSVELTAQVSDALAPYVLDGCTQKLQRKPASEWEKAAAGYAKRPEGFKRDSIPFSPEQASKLAVVMGAAVADVAEVNVTEYTGGGDATVSRKQALAVIEKKIAEGKVDALALAVEYKGEPLTAENADFVEAVHRFIRGK